MDAVDTYLMPGWMGWAYKSFGPSVSNSSDGVYNPDGSVRQEIAKKLARTYAQAVAGKTKAMKFSDSTAELSLTYDICVECGETEIYHSEAFYYPNGIVFESKPEGAITWEKTEKNRIVIRPANSTKSGTEVSIGIKSK